MKTMSKSITSSKVPFLIIKTNLQLLHIFVSSTIQFLPHCPKIHRLLYYVKIIGQLQEKLTLNQLQIRQNYLV